MKINELSKRHEIGENIKLNNAYLQYEKLLSELRIRELPETIIALINKDIDELNSLSDNGKVLRRLLRKKQTQTITLLEKKLKLVPINYYRNMWIVVGMAAFGIPLGAAIGSSVGNMSFLGVGMPLGMVIGLGLGTGLDKKALKEGRQLNLEIK